MTIYLGTEASELVERARSAYAQGCTSLCAVGDRSWHDHSTAFYALRRTTGRRLAIDKNELSWLGDGKWRVYPYVLNEGAPK